MGELSSAPAIRQAPAITTLGQRILPRLGYIAAAAGLAWVLYDIRPADLLDHVSRIKWWWVALAVFADVLSYVCQGWRWKLLLRPVGEISTLESTQAIYAGLFVNEVLPMRVGELVRAYLAARHAAADFVAVLPSMVVERLFDGVWLAFGVGLAARFVSLPKRLALAGEALGLVAVAAVALFVGLALYRRKSAARQANRAVSCKPIRTLLSLLARIGSGMSEVGRTRAFYLSFILSLALPLLQALAFWLVMISFGLRLPFAVGAAVFLIVHLGTAVPNAPANVGSYQFFTVLGLTLFGVEKSLATEFSVVVFMLLTLPLLGLGFLALSRSGMTLASVQRACARPSRSDALTGKERRGGSRNGVP
jgi:glycosyltransferase 2 family protein